VQQVIAADHFRVGIGQKCNSTQTALDTRGTARPGPIPVKLARGFDFYPAKR
jgi:hypothetical protein